MGQGFAPIPSKEQDLSTEGLQVPEVDRTEELLKATTARDAHASQVAIAIEDKLDDLQYNQMLEEASRSIAVVSTTSPSDVRSRELVANGEVLTALGTSRRKRGAMSESELRDELLAALLVHFHGTIAAVDSLDDFVAKVTQSNQAGQSALAVTTQELAQVAQDLARRLTNGDTLLQLHISTAIARQDVANLLVSSLDGLLPEEQIGMLHRLVMEEIDPANDDAAIRGRSDRPVLTLVSATVAQVDPTPTPTPTLMPAPAPAPIVDARTIEATEVLRTNVRVMAVLESERDELKEQLTQKRLQIVSLAREIMGSQNVPLTGVEPDFDLRMREVVKQYLIRAGKGDQVSAEAGLADLVRLIPVPDAFDDREGHRRVRTILRLVDDVGPPLSGTNGQNLFSTIQIAEARLVLLQRQFEVREGTALTLLAPDRRAAIESEARSEVKHLIRELSKRAEAGQLDATFVALKAERDTLEWRACQIVVRQLLAEGNGEEARRVLQQYVEQYGSGSLGRGSEYLTRAQRQVAVLTDILEAQTKGIDALNIAYDRTAECGRRDREKAGTDRETVSDSSLREVAAVRQGLIDRRAEVFQMVGRGDFDGAVLRMQQERVRIFNGLTNGWILDPTLPSGLTSRFLRADEIATQMPPTLSALGSGLLEFRPMLAVTAATVPTTAVAPSPPGYVHLLNALDSDANPDMRTSLTAFAQCTLATPEQRALIGRLPANVSDRQLLDAAMGVTPPQDRWRLALFVAGRNHGPRIEAWLVEGNGTPGQRAQFNTALATARRELAGEVALTPEVREQRAYEKALIALIRSVSSDEIGRTVSPLLGYLEYADTLTRVRSMLDTLQPTERDRIIDFYRTHHGRSLGETLLSRSPAGGDAASLLLLRQFSLTKPADWTRFFPGGNLPAEDVFVSALRSNLKRAGAVVAVGLGELQPDIETYGKQRGELLAVVSLASRTRDLELLERGRKQLEALDAAFETRLTQRIAEFERMQPGVATALERGQFRSAVKMRTDQIAEATSTELRTTTGDLARDVGKVSDLLRQGKREEALDLLRFLNLSSGKMEVFRILYREGIGLPSTDAVRLGLPRDLASDLTGPTPAPTYRDLVLLLVMPRENLLMSKAQREQEFHLFDLRRMNTLAAQSREADLLHYLVGVGSREHLQNLKASGFVVPEGMREAREYFDAVLSNDRRLAQVIELRHRISYGSADPDRIAIELARLYRTGEFAAIALAYQTKYGKSLGEALRQHMPTESHALFNAFASGDRRAIGVELGAWALRLHLREDQATLGHELLNLVPHFASTAAERAYVYAQLDQRCRAVHNCVLSVLIFNRGGAVGRGDLNFVHVILGNTGAVSDQTLRAFLQSRESVLLQRRSLEEGRKQMADLIVKANEAGAEMQAEYLGTARRASSAVVYINEGSSAARTRNQAYATLYDRQQAHLKYLREEGLGSFDRTIESVNAYGNLALDDILRGDASSASLNMQQSQRETQRLQVHVRTLDLCSVRKRDLEEAEGTLRDAADQERRYRWWAGNIYGLVKAATIITVSLVATPMAGIAVAAIWELGEMFVNRYLRGFTWQQAAANAAFNFALNATGCLLTAFRVGAAAGKFAAFNRYTQEYVTANVTRMFFTFGGRAGAREAITRIGFQAAMKAGEAGFVRGWGQLVLHRMFATGLNFAPGAAVPFLGLGGHSDIHTVPKDIKLNPALLTPAVIAAVPVVVGQLTSKPNEPVDPGVVQAQALGSPGPGGVAPAALINPALLTPPPVLGALALTDPLTGKEPPKPIDPAEYPLLPPQAVALLENYKSISYALYPEGRIVWTYDLGNGQFAYVHQLGDQLIIVIVGEDGKPQWGCAVGFNEAPTWLNAEWYKDSKPLWSPTGVQTWEFRSEPNDEPKPFIDKIDGKDKVKDPDPANVVVEWVERIVEAIKRILERKKKDGGDGKPPPVAPLGAGAPAPKVPPPPPPKDGAAPAAGPSPEFQRQVKLINAYIVRLQAEGFEVNSDIRAEIARCVKLLGTLKDSYDVDVNGIPKGNALPAGQQAANPAKIRQELQESITRLQALVDKLADLLPMKGVPVAGANGVPNVIGDREQLVAALKAAIAEFQAVVNTLPAASPVPAGKTDPLPQTEPLKATEPLRARDNEKNKDAEPKYDANGRRIDRPLEQPKVIGVDLGDQSKTMQPAAVPNGSARGATESTPNGVASSTDRTTATARVEQERAIELVLERQARDREANNAAVAAAFVRVNDLKALLARSDEHFAALTGTTSPNVVSVTSRETNAAAERVFAATAAANERREVVEQGSDRKNYRTAEFTSADRDVTLAASSIERKSFGSRSDRIAESAAVQDSNEGRVKEEAITRQSKLDEQAQSGASARVARLQSDAAIQSEASMRAESAARVEASARIEANVRVQAAARAEAAVRTEATAQAVVAAQAQSVAAQFQTQAALGESNAGSSRAAVEAVMRAASYSAATIEQQGVPGTFEGTSIRVAPEDSDRRDTFSSTNDSRPAVETHDMNSRREYVTERVAAIAGKLAGVDESFHSSASPTAPTFVSGVQANDPKPTMAAVSGFSAPISGPESVEVVVPASTPVIASPDIFQPEPAPRDSVLAPSSSVLSAIQAAAANIGTSASMSAAPPTADDYLRRTQEHFRDFDSGDGAEAILESELQAAEDAAEASTEAKRKKASKKRAADSTRLRDQLLWQMTERHLSFLMRERLKKALLELGLTDTEIEELVRELSLKRGLEPEQAESNSNSEQQMPPLEVPPLEKIVQTGLEMNEVSHHAPARLTRAELYRKLLAEKNAKKFSDTSDT